MDFSPLTTLNPLDGRYHDKTKALAKIFSEASLIQHRTGIEVRYLQFLSKHKIIRSFNSEEQKQLDDLLSLSEKQIKRVKTIEKKTHHDVKAVEYFLREEFEQSSVKDCTPYIHLGLTSADINNLAYGQMITKAHQHIVLSQLTQLLDQLKQMAAQYQDLPMLARTHGQPALPTTFGKEVSVTAMRLLKQLEKLANFKLTGKLTGAVGSLQALDLVFSQHDWLKLSTEFVSSLGLKPNLHTTQINPADNLIELLQIYHRLNSILIDLNQDLWRYISDHWLIQNKNKEQVGSSTMPQKVNPIRFENSEGNLTLANGLIETLSRKLPISRLQRDLSNSTINRNIGLVFAYNHLGYTSLSSGLNTIKPNQEKIKQNLNDNYNILGEALQTKLRQKQDPQAYEKTAELTKTKKLSQADWQRIVADTAPDLVDLTPADYTGLAIKLTQKAVKEIDLFLTEFNSNKS